MTIRSIESGTGPRTVSPRGPTPVADRTPISKAMHSDTDVLIVGAGPAGLTLALLLAERGRTVAVYERWADAFPLPRAAAMSHETVRTFQSAGLLEQLRPCLDLELTKLATSLYASDGEVLGTMTFPGAGESGFPPMISFHQPDVDRVLGEMCETHSRVEVYRGWDAQAIEQSDDDAVVSFDPVDGDRPREGDPIVARGTFVVGCDGANSTIRLLMNAEVTDTGFSSSWLVVDTFPVPGAPAIGLFGHVLDPLRPATMAPAGKGRQRFEFMIVDGDDPEHIADEDSVWRLLKRRDVNPERVQIARRAIYTFRGRWAKTWRDGRILLAGDAAHQMPPFMGQGFNSGVRDTIALAWRIDLILGGTAELELLDSYTTERLHHVKQIIESSVSIGQLMCITDPQAAGKRDAQLRKMRDNPQMHHSQPEWRLGPGCFLPDDPAAGFLGHQGRVEKNGRSGLLDDLAGAGHFVLFGKDIDPLAALSDEARAVWRQLDGLTVTIGAEDFRDVDSSYADWFEKLGATVVLVRPDFQVYGASANAGRANEIVIALAKQLHMRATHPSTVGQPLDLSDMP
jgi:2-polyprenyl-6-methoxyphenol hydroxylase-like FAD-dependent oxidoreductase